MLSLESTAESLHSEFLVNVEEMAGGRGCVKRKKGKEGERRKVGMKGKERGGKKKKKGWTEGGGSAVRRED